MKKTLFLALALCGALPVMAESGLTLTGEGIANNDSWNLYATFDKLAYTDTFTTLATVNLNNNDWMAIYAVGYTYSRTDNTLTLGMASYANPNSWNTLSLDSVTLGADTPLSFALSHNGSNKGGNDTMALRVATGNTTTNFTVSDPVNSTKGDTYSNRYISSVSLGTAATSGNIYGKSFKLTPATGDSVNLVSARLEHEPYTQAAFEEFVLEEAPWGKETVRYTTVESGNKADVYVYNTPNGEVTFNPAKFDESGNLTLNKTIDLTAHTTFIVDDGKTVEINGANTFTGADQKTHEKGSVFGNGELVKSGGGTLKIRLNDTNRDIASTENNDYEGSVTVEEGTLYLFHHDIVEGSKHKARLGGGNNTVITVKEGAVLEMGAQTEISIPLGAHSSSEAYAHNIVIDGGAVNVHADTEYGIPEMHPTTSTIRNAVITREGIDQVDTKRIDQPDTEGIDHVDKELRAQLIVSGITVFDSRVGDKVEFKHADIITDDFYFNGHTIIRNTNLFADETFIASSLDTEGLFSLEVVDGSHVVYGAGADAHSGGTWGHVNNVYVDKTSKMQTAKNSLESHWGGCLHIQGECKLDIEDIMLQDGGLANRTNGKVQGVLDGKVLTLDDIQYTTDQLSGDMLIKYDQDFDIYGTLDLHLKDPSSALPDGTTLTNTVFTLTLTNFDSSLLVVDKFGNLDPSVAKLTIDAFKDTPWHLVYGRYDAETNNSIFTFSTMKHLHIVPEPATATLSLLALAALATRRRRR